MCMIISLWKGAEPGLQKEDNVFFYKILFKLFC